MRGTSDPVLAILEARQAAVPLIVVSTADESALLTRLRASLAGEFAFVTWDAFSGLLPLSDLGREWLLSLDVEQPMSLSDAFRAVMTEGRGLPLRGLLAVHLAHRTAWDDTGTIQGVCLLRDWCKARGQSILLLTQGGTVPPEFSRDVLTVEDALPTEAEIAEISAEIMAGVRTKRDVAEPSADDSAGAVAAMIGLPRFGIEQAFSVVYRSRGRVDLAELWRHKEAMIRQIPGLRLEHGGADLSSIGGLCEISRFLRMVCLGEDAPRIIVRLDDWDKSVSAQTTESSGTVADAAGVMLTAMEDRGWRGVIGTGIPGCGKSWISKCVAATFGLRTLAFDLGATRSKYVGSSEQSIRAVVETLWSIAGSRVFFLASCNRPEAISTELRRRFSGGIWFFDQPDAGERDAIWPIQLAAYGLPLDSERPDDLTWTGAEIRNCCEWAHRLRVTLREAARYIVPVLSADPEWIDRLRRQASGAFLSASVPGVYRMPGASLDVPQLTARRF
jgi:hypothetical protein